MSQARVETAPAATPTDPAPVFDLSGFLLKLGKNSTAPLGKCGYPRPPAPPKPPKKDECLMVEGLSALELAAMRTLGLREEIALKRPVVKQAYRRLVLTLHPDRHPPGLSVEEKRRRTAEFQSIHEAYTVLDQAFRRLPRKQQ